MTLAEIILSIQTRSGDSNITEATITGWVNTALRLIANRDDWSWLMKVDEDDVTVANQQEYALPTDLKKMYSLRVGDTTSTETTATQYSFLGYGEKNMAINNDVDHCYYINPASSKYGLIPTPAAANYKVFQKYFGYPTTVSCVSATPDMPTQYHDMLVDFGLARYFEQEDEMDKTVLYETKLENAIEKMKTDFPATGYLGRMRDIRELAADNNYQQYNIVGLGR